MEQQLPPAGWYHDPAGRGARYWTGTGWADAIRAPVRRPGRTPARIWLVVAVLVLVCVGSPCIGFGVTDSIQRGNLEKSLDSLAIPASMTLINQARSGNALCLEECNRLSRRYSSPLSKPDTFQIFAEALQRRGYHCTDWCTGTGEEGGSRISRWVRAGRPTINLDVFSTADPHDAAFVDPPLDATRQIHADLAT